MNCTPEESRRKIEEWRKGQRALQMIETMKQPVSAATLKICADLLAQEIDFNFTAYPRQTVLHAAAKKDWGAVTKDILARAPQLINAVDDEGETPLMKATAAGCYAAVDLLLAAGADINIARKDGKTVFGLVPAVVPAGSSAGDIEDIRDALDMARKVEQSLRDVKTGMKLKRDVDSPKKLKFKDGQGGNKNQGGPQA